MHIIWDLRLINGVPALNSGMRIALMNRALTVT